jgi:hypothetical protein
VGIDNDTIVISALGKNNLAGAAYVFRRNQDGADNWGQIKKLTGQGVIPALFGESVAISNTTIVIGESRNNFDPGAAYIYERNHGGADNWGQIKKLTASDGAGNFAFGGAVGINGNTIVIGAYNKGGAYIYERNQGGVNNWGEVKILAASDADFGDSFGTGIAILADTIVVGAWSKNSFTGAAYIFERNQGGANNWGQTKKLIASDAAIGDQFGSSIAITTDLVLVGASRKNSVTGAVYVFGRNQGGANSWGQVDKLTAIDGKAGDDFGSSLGIRGGTIIVGASQYFSRNKGKSYIFTTVCPPMICNSQNLI